MSKVVRIHQHGGPEELRFEDLDVGEPARRDHSLLVRGLSRVSRPGARLRITDNHERGTERELADRALIPMPGYPCSIF